MQTKQNIIDAIRQTAKENGGKPLGTARFEKEAGIKIYEWKKFWPRFGEALKEAGFESNQLQGGYADEFLFQKVIGVIRKLGKFPTYDELRIQRNYDIEFPHRSVFTNFGPKQKLAEKIIEYCKGNPDCGVIIEACQSVLKSPIEENKSSTEDQVVFGEVYLYKMGRYYTIGMTIDPIRRGAEHGRMLPEKGDMIHTIKTDDPSGVEAYWHKRFEAKRTNNSSKEWFDLSSSDVKAFKRWKRII